MISVGIAASRSYSWAGEVRTDSALLTHRVKTMYGFDELAEAVRDEERRRRAYDMLRLLM